MGSSDLNTNNGKIRVALIGAGRFGAKRADAVGKSARSALTIVADLTTELAGAIGQRFGCKTTSDWHEAVTQDNVDAVIVSTPTHLSSHVSLLAVQAGKHVLTEKPCAISSAELGTVVRTAQSLHVRVKAGYNHRYHPAIRRAHELFEQGAIGRPLFVRCIYGHGGRVGYESEWRSKASLSGGGELLDQGVHGLDLFQWFLGEFEEVAGMVSTAFWPIAQAEDNAFALLRTPGNVVAQLHASWTNWKNTFSFEVFGEKGYLKVNGLGGSYGTERLCCGLRNRPGDVPEEVWTEYPGPDDSLEREWEEFLDAVAQGREPSSNGHEACRTLKIVEAIRRSAVEGCMVRL
jgi:predicted dehydrogenase